MFVKKQIYKMRWLSLVIMLITLALPANNLLFGSEYSNEIYAKFIHGVIDWPEAFERRECDSTCIKSPEVLSIVTQFGPSEIEKMFKNGEPDQVLVTNPAGIDIVKPSLKRLYKIILSDSLEAFQVSAQS